MPIVNVKGVVNKMQFPDDMDINNIRTFLQKKFTQRAVGGQSDALSPQDNIAAPYKPSLMERAGQGVADVLSNTGIISNRYGAQQIGKNVAAIGEMLPGIGDVAAVDDFSRAAAGGDNLGMGLAALGVIPVAGDIAGDALKKVFKGANPVNTFDTIRNRFKRDSKIVDLPQGKVGSDEFERIKAIDPKAKVTGRNADGTIKIEFLEEYQPKQVSENNPNLFEFDPDSLEVTENTLKRTDNFKGDTAKPIAVTKSEGDFFILDGHHRAKLAKEQGRNVNAIVIPEADVKKMRKQGFNQADMLDEWTKQSLPMDDAASSIKPARPTGKPIMDEAGNAKFIEGDDGKFFKLHKRSGDWVDITGTVGEANAKAEKAKGLTPNANKSPAQYRAESTAQAEGYKMQHTAPLKSDGNPSGVNVEDAFPGMYSGHSSDYLTGVSYDDKAIKVIQGMKGKPEKSVTIYRAVPKDVKEINATDWITTTKEYAQDHMEGEQGWHILSKKVKAKDIATDGNSIHEFGYDPTN